MSGTPNLFSPHPILKDYLDLLFSRPYVSSWLTSTNSLCMCIEMHTLTVLYDSAVCSHHTLIEPGIPIGIAHLPKAAHVLFSSNKLAC